MTLSILEWAETVNLYASGLTCEEVGRKLGISGGGVWNRLKRHGVPRRHPGPPKKLSFSTLFETERLYKRMGSLRLAAEKLGISHEAVRLRLRSLQEIYESHSMET